MDTPCTKVCVVDRQAGLCIGCGRSLAEIGGWAGYSDAERRRLMAELPRRLTALRLRQLTPGGAVRGGAP
jgi:predicted Fe-S protein YdhL (DUF1289 family)